MTTKPTVEELREERKRLRLQAEVGRLKRSTRLAESLTPDWVGQYVDLLDRYRDGATLLTPISTPNDRRAGRNFPLFQTEQELALLRGPARILCATSPYAIGLLGGLTSYVLGQGYTYRVTSKDDAHEKLVAAAQDVVDDFLDRTEWAELEAELFWRSREDGEYFLRHGLGDDGRTWVRTVEPEQVVQPPGTDQAEWSFGIHTPPDDVQAPDLYWVSYLSNSAQGEEVKPEDLVHCKVNTKRSIKRGLTDFCFDTYASLDVAGRLRRNMAEGAAVQAALAGIRQHESASLAQAQSFQQGLVDYSTSDATGKQTDVQKLMPGTFLDMPKGSQWVDPPGAHNASAHVEVLQACLRGAGVRWNAPEWLGSADASNNNFASSLTAESPFVITVKRSQRFYRQRFLLTLWIVLRHAVKAGRLPPEALKLLDIQCEAPSPEARDPQKEAQVDDTYVRMGVKSVQTVSQEQGLDYEREQIGIEEHRERAGDPGQGMPLPGEDGSLPAGAGSGRGDQGGEPGGDQGPAAGANLSQTVGGLQAINALQQSVYDGQIPKKAAINNVVLLFGFSPEQAATLFPDDEPEKTADDGQSDDGQGGGLPPGTPPDQPPGPDDGMLGDGLAESVLMESELLEAGFTGVVTAKNGAKYYYVNGKRVKGAQGYQAATGQHPSQAPQASKPAAGKPAAAGAGGKAPPAAGKKLTPTQQKKANALAAVQSAEAKLKAGQALTAGELASLPGHLAQLTVAELKAFQQRAGLTPNAKLKAGHVQALVAYASGRPQPGSPFGTPAAPKVTAAGQKKAAARAAVANLKAKVKANTALTAQELADLPGHLGLLTKAELQQLLSDLKYPAHPGSTASQMQTRVMNRVHQLQSAGVAAGGIPGPGPAGPPPGPAAQAAALKYPHRLGQSDREDLEDLLEATLDDDGTSADQIDLGVLAKSRALFAKIQPFTDGKVTHFDVERALKNLAIRNATKPLAQPLFDYQGKGRGPNHAIPAQGRPSLTSDEQLAVQKYNSTVYQPLNRSLRARGEPPGRYKKVFADLQTAFAKAGAFPSPVLTSRRISVDPAGLQQLVTDIQAHQKAGVPYQMTGMVSTATGPPDPNFPGNFTFRINATHGLDVRPHSHHCHVNELLLNHGSQFTVKGLKQVAGGGWEVELDQIAPPPGKAAPRPVKSQQAAGATGQPGGKPGFFGRLFGQKPAAAATPAAPAAGAAAPKPKTAQPQTPKPSPANLQDFQAVRDILDGTNKHLAFSGKYGGTEDTALTQMMHDTGRAGVPQVHDKAGIDALKAKGWKILYRGTSGKAFNDQFRTGEMYSGSGIYGNGTYAAIDQGSEAAAKATATGYGHRVMRMAIPPNAKIVDHQTLDREIATYRAGLAADHKSGKISTKEYVALRTIAKDKGRFACWKGYDMIQAPTDYTVILNRSIMAVEDQDQ